MIDCWLWDVVDSMRHEEEKITGNTRDYTEADLFCLIFKTPLTGKGFVAAGSLCYFANHALLCV